MTTLVITVAILAAWNVWLTHSIICLCKALEINMDVAKFESETVRRLRERLSKLENAPEEP
jgi:hypothetical protein